MYRVELIFYSIHFIFIVLSIKKKKINRIIEIKEKFMKMKGYIGDLYDEAIFTYIKDE